MIKPCLTCNLLEFYSLQAARQSSVKDVLQYDVYMKIVYETPQLRLAALDCSGFLCVSIFEMTGTITGHETGTEVDMSDYSLFTDWEGDSN